MNLTVVQLRAFAAVIDGGGFGEAAECLAMTQPAVSHAIATLEKAIGAPVLQRKPQLQPTPLGEKILPHARAALASVEAVQATVREHLGLTAGLVRLAAAPTVCQGLMPELLMRWRSTHPRVEVQIFEGDDDELALWLEGGMVDAAILIDPDPMPDRGVIVGRDTFQAVVRRDHPLANEVAVTLHDLLDDPFIISTGGCEAQISRIFAQAHESMVLGQRVREVGTLLSMIVGHVGISIMPSLGEAMLPRDLVMVPLVPVTDRTLVFTGPMSRPWNPLVGALRDACGETVLA
ncbi:MAG TPA: LysR family transcriptional regulator [Thermomicrobiales bacterium]|nr:LysR family transcriptional regulator [Thermomicrobiales bacterium]